MEIEAGDSLREMREISRLIGNVLAAMAGGYVSWELLRGLEEECKARSIFGPVILGCSPS